MALIICNECGNQVSDKAAACPHCGAPVAQSKETHRIPTMPNSEPVGKQLYCSKCIIDKKQADEIKKAVCTLLNISQDMTLQIKRIGTNYNQIAHAMNKSVKYNSPNTVTNTSRNMRTSIFAIKQQLQHEELNKNERIELEKAAANLISDSTLSDLIGTYTAAAKTMQDALVDIYKAVM